VTENERRIKRRVQLVVAGSMAFFFVLFMTMVVQIAIMNNQKRMERSLNAKQAELMYLLQYESDKIDYYKSDKFIDEYALKELGYGRDGAKIFK
jgi:cell division protein FtsB